MADILDTRQAGEILGILPVSVIRAINRGTLYAVKFGKSWMIQREDVERYRREVQRPKSKKTQT